MLRIVHSSPPAPLRSILCEWHSKADVRKKTQIAATCLHRCMADNPHQSEIPFAAGTDIDWAVLLQISGRMENGTCEQIPAPSEDNSWLLERGGVAGWKCKEAAEANSQAPKQAHWPHGSRFCAEYSGSGIVRNPPSSLSGSDTMAECLHEAWYD